MAKANFKDASRGNWEGEVTERVLVAGAVMRIADATELMAKNWQTLINQRDHFERRSEELAGALAAERRSSAALRGQITKLKK